MDDELTLRLIVRRLAVYLHARPFACDSAEGMALWWFKSEVAMIDLMAALEWARQHHLIEELKAADGHVRYRRLATVEQLTVLIADIGSGPNGDA